MLIGGEKLTLWTGLAEGLLWVWCVGLFGLGLDEGLCLAEELALWLD